MGVDTAEGSRIISYTQCGERKCYCFQGFWMHHHIFVICSLPLIQRGEGWVWILHRHLFTLDTVVLVSFQQIVEL